MGFGWFGVVAVVGAVFLGVVVGTPDSSSVSADVVVPVACFVVVGLPFAGLG